MSFHIRVSLDPAADGHTNMAKDRALLASAEMGNVACRVYSWDGAWISLGRFQTPERDLIDPEFPWVLRPTGGKAVLHGHDATIGLAVPMKELGCGPREVKKAYRRIARPIIEALRNCGLPAALAEDTTYDGLGSQTSDCFAFNSPNDIVDPETGQKVCGCAMSVSDGLVLIQASVPNGPPLVDPASVFRDPALIVGPLWDSSALAMHLEESLRYNFANVRS